MSDRNRFAHPFAHIFARIAALAAWAVVGLILQSTVVRRADAQTNDSSGPPLDTIPTYFDELVPSRAPNAPPSLNTNRAPIMSMLDKMGLARSLDEARINIFGYAEASYTYNADNPARQLNLGRVFDINDNRIQINQLDLHIERKADPHQFDLGGRIELLYGTDSRFIHSSDFIDYGNKETTSTSSSGLYRGPEYQFDIPQIYFDLTLPVGEGIRLRFGKFLFFKQIDPNASVFYSHSFTFGAALPFTLTGITGEYRINDRLTIEGGFSRGWGQTFTDTNGAIDGLGRVRYKLGDATDLSFALIVGPELFGDNSHYRAVFDGTLTYSVDEHLTLLFDGVYGYQAEPSGATSDQWYGLSTYAVYKVNDALNVNSRAEFYRDEEGFTTGIRQTLFEATLGLTITPFATDPIGQNFKIRPEIRYDYSTARYFNGLTDHGQFTMAIDAYFDY